MIRSRLTDRELEEIRDRSDRAWNRMVQQAEDEYRAQLANEGGQPTERHLRVVGDE